MNLLLVAVVSSALAFRIRASEHVTAKRKSEKDARFFFNSSSIARRRQKRLNSRAPHHLGVDLEPLLLAERVADDGKHNDKQDKYTAHLWDRKALSKHFIWGALRLLLISMTQPCQSRGVVRLLARPAHTRGVHPASWHAKAERGARAV